MKIVYLANIRLPTEKAHGIQIMKMCEAFANLGLEVELIVPRRLNSIKQDPFEYYGAERNFKITKLPCLDLIPFKLGKPGFVIQTATFLISAKIHLLFKKRDVLYTREPLVGFFFNNFILEIHTIPEKIQRFRRAIWNKASGIIAVTTFIKKKIVEAGIPENKIIVAPDGVDLKQFDAEVPKEEARKKIGLPQKTTLIGYVGMLKTMGMEKGIKSAIECLKYLSENATLVIVGGNDEDIAFYKNFTEKSYLKERVIFTGRISHTNIPLYLKAFDILIAPFPENKHYKFYMSPLKIFEYMASERPIVASDLPSIREIADEKEIAFAKPDDAGSLAEAIKKILDNEEFGKLLAKNVKEKVKNFTWQKRAEKVKEFIFKNRTL